MKYIQKVIFLAICFLPVFAGTVFGETLTHGHEVLLDKGLQLRGTLINLQAGFDTTLWEESNFTTLNVTTNVYQNLIPQGIPGAPNQLPMYINWVTDSNMYLGTSEYTDNIVCIQYQDEQSIVGSQLASISAEVATLKARFPHAIVYLNQSSRYHTDGNGTLVPLTLDILKLYTRVVKPDMLHFTEYTFQDIYNENSLNKLYGYLELYRKAGLAGLTGDGTQPIPVGKYVGTFYETTNPYTRFPSESEFRLDQFAAWAFGFKSVEAFVYTTGSTTIGMFTEGQSQIPTAQYFQYAELNRQSQNLGDALVQLITTDVRMKMGYHSDGTTNELPEGVSAWDSTADDYLKSITAFNIGDLNNGLADDVIVGFFKPLDASLVEDGAEDDVYFMVVNGLTDVAGDADECQQYIHLEFDFSGTDITRLLRMSRDTGEVEIVNLVSDGSGLYHLDLLLDGGTGDLFKYDTGSLFISAPQPERPFLMGDANGDGVVSAGDYAAVQANFGHTLVTEGATTPEPATLALLSLGGLNLIRRRRIDNRG